MEASVESSGKDLISDLCAKTSDTAANEKISALTIIQLCLISFCRTRSLKNLKLTGKNLKTLFKNSEFINPHFVNTAKKLDSIVCNLEDEMNNLKISKSKPVKENYIYHGSKLRELNFERNHSRKTFQNYRDTVLKRKLNKLNKQIKQKIETDAFKNELLNVNATDGTVWKFVTPFKKKIKNIPSLNEPAGIANTDLEKANFLAENLETLFTLNSITNPDTEELVADSVKRFRTETKFSL
ncbi:hypothetical protein AVEN_50305-1 [Araneus ventricosus]|uniref:Uncharacterized protein n=1 Tax=Araneus ventricosus TaxID=182803 RepID=A0A4Y2RW93_ARAVE|nr:hypothetical protein AVEN_50305-1 [Araneus ventricosus]